jgi:hypothetical protein
MSREYEQLGIKFCNELGLVPKGLYQAVEDDNTVLREALYDLIVTHHNGQNVQRWVSDHIEDYKSLVDWEDE